MQKDHIMNNYVVPMSWWQQVAPLHYGYEECLPGHAFGPAVRDHYLLHYVLEGKGRFHRDGQTYDVYKGDLFVIRPEEITTYQADREDPWQYAWVGFSCGQKLAFLDMPVIRQAPIQHIFIQLKMLENRPKNEGLIFTLTFELLWRLSKSTLPTEKERLNTYAVYTKTYLDVHYMQPINIQSIAAALHIDRRYLTSLFKKAYQMPPQTYLTQLRLTHARNFLSQGCGVTEAALMAGFSDLSNFSRQYKAKYGVSPVCHRGSQ